MNRTCLVALVTAMAAASAACVELEEPAAHTITQPLGGTCNYITCGRNTKAVGNGFVDQVFFDGTRNARNQQFVSWVSAGGATITPRLGTRSLWGQIAGVWRTGSALIGSIMTIEDAGGELLQLRFTDAAQHELPNGVTVWTYRIDKRRSRSAWRPLCSLFDHTDDEIARYALIGTRELVHEHGKHVTAHATTELKLTIGCPNSATGKLLSLGALSTTAASGEEPMVSEMTSVLRALTLSPIGQKSYTKSGVGVMFNVTRTGVNNHGESWAGGVEGWWDEDGAICFEHLRINDEDLISDLWNDTHVPACSEIDLSRHEHLVSTYLYFGVYPSYPPPAPPPPSLPIGGYAVP
ncbi:MAG: ADYC domain-containing protein [Kofleriaceae bacterium]